MATPSEKNELTCLPYYSEEPLLADHYLGYEIVRSQEVGRS